METKKWSYWLSHLVAPTTSCPPARHGVAAGADPRLSLPRLAGYIIKSSKHHLGRWGEKKKKKRFQQCEENFLSVKNILCSACGSTQGVLFTVPASPTYYTAGSGATIRVQLITW